MARSLRSHARRFGRKVCCIPKRKSSQRSKDVTAAQRKRREIARQRGQAVVPRNATVQIPRGILRKPYVHPPKAASDPGIIERGIQGLRGGGCGPSKPARPQQQPSRTSQRSNEEVMLANLRRRYPDYGVTPSATSAGVSVLRPDTHPGADRRSANVPDAITPRGSVRGVRGGCSNPIDDEEEVEPSRVSLPRRGWRADAVGKIHRHRRSRDYEARLGAQGRLSRGISRDDQDYGTASVRGVRGGCSNPVDEEQAEPNRVPLPKGRLWSANEASAISRQRQSQNDNARRAAVKDYHGSPSNAHRYQDVTLRGGADENEPTFPEKTILSKLKRFFCCFKAEPESVPGQPQPLTPIGHRYSTMQQGEPPFRTLPLVQIPEDGLEVPLEQLVSQRGDGSGTVKRRSAAPKFPSLSRQQARVPEDDDSSQGVREIEATDQIELQPQSRFSASSSGDEDDLDRGSSQANELPPLTVKEWKQAVQEAKSDMAETQRSIERLERELNTGLRGGQDESEVHSPRLSLWTRLRRNLCCGQPDDDESRTSSVISQPGSPPTPSYRYWQPHPEEGGIGQAMTLPEPDPNVATPESLLGLHPRSHSRDALFDNDTTASSTIRQVSEPTPRTPGITWSRSTKNRNASQQELRTPDKTIAPEDIGLPVDSISVRHRRGQSPLNGSERMLPLISSVLQDGGGAQRSRRLRVQTTPPRPVTYTPFNSPTEALFPSRTSDSEHASPERPRSSIFPEQSPRL